MTITIIAFLLVLTILVLIHELGHYLTAKKLGIKVEEFGVGFPPRVFGKKIGETLYSINLLPIGGFVKLYGEDEAGGGKIGKSGVVAKDIKRAFYARPLWQRMVVVTAGVVMNFILAVIIISSLFATQGVALPSEKVVISDVAKNSPAEAAGIQKEDHVTEINDVSITTPETFISETQKYKGEPVEITIVRDGETMIVNLTPRENPPEGEGAMGVGITNIEIKKYAWWEAPFYGTIEAGKFSFLILQGLATMVADFVTTGAKPEGVAGPIGVAQLTGEAVKVGVPAILWFTALLSLNLAVLNILPIPALDGGRFFFMIIELVIRRKVSPRYEAIAHGVGLVLLLGLMLIITVLDVSRLIQGESILP